MDNELVVTISLKEIYDELKNASSQIQGLSLRIERIEEKISKQEDKQAEFKQKLTMQLVSSFILPILLAVYIFVLKGGN